MQAKRLLGNVGACIPHADGSQPQIVRPNSPPRRRLHSQHLYPVHERKRPLRKHSSGKSLLSVQKRLSRTACRLVTTRRPWVRGFRNKDVRRTFIES